jgi:two-component system, NarL family, response regulator LiaR
MSQQIKVMVVDDHTVVRSGLTAFLSVYDEFDLIGEAANGKEAVEKAMRLKPDVILMDMMMPEMDGAEATRLIKSAIPETQIIILTSFKDEKLVQDALKAGAIGYILKNASADELAKAIIHARQGKPTLSPEATQVLVSAAGARPNHQDELTAREKDVLIMLVEGLTNPEIAEKLFLSRSTVKFHVSSILAKLDAGSRTEAVSIALQKKLI